MRTIESPSALMALVGQELGVSDWVEVTQEQIDLFARATGDFQWIHVDVERAKAGPYGSTIAHGYLTLSMVPRFLEGSVELRGVRMGLNYGLNKVRFVSPVPAGSRLRGRIRLKACEPINPEGVQMTSEVTVEREGQDKPVCVAETISRWYV